MGLVIQQKLKPEGSLPQFEAGPRNHGKAPEDQRLPGLLLSALGVRRRRNPTPIQLTGAISASPCHPVYGEGMNQSRRPNDPPAGPWDLSGAPALREALIDALAAALVEQVERDAASDPGSGPT